MDYNYHRNSYHQFIEQNPLENYINTSLDIDAESLISSVRAHALNLSIKDPENKTKQRHYFSIHHINSYHFQCQHCYRVLLVSYDILGLVSCPNCHSLIQPNCVSRTQQHQNYQDGSGVDEDSKMFVITDLNLLLLEYGNFLSSKSIWMGLLKLKSAKSGWSTVLAVVTDSVLRLHSVEQGTSKLNGYAICDEIQWSQCSISCYENYSAGIHTILIYTNEGKCLELDAGSFGLYRYWMAHMVLRVQNMNLGLCWSKPVAKTLIRRSSHESDVSETTIDTITTTLTNATTSSSKTSKSKRFLKFWKPKSSKKHSNAYNNTILTPELPPQPIKPKPVSKPIQQEAPPKENESIINRKMQLLFGTRSKSKLYNTKYQICLHPALFSSEPNGWYHYTDQTPSLSEMKCDKNLLSPTLSSSLTDDTSSEVTTPSHSRHSSLRPDIDLEMKLELTPLLDANHVFDSIIQSTPDSADSMSHHSSINEMQPLGISHTKPIEIYSSHSNNGSNHPGSLSESSSWDPATDLDEIRLSHKGAFRSLYDLGQDPSHLDAINKLHLDQGQDSVISHLIDMFPLPPRRYDR
ncbi:hypothetical protein CONCODRAFT_6467 [Conidiobolus coronatus NRRL 28638]|uniref:Uncharacterized protein n=1 Tax=Conidiobolus coronatus (strain ATCC 28846 / CBS 209.66 / NRRL 28638) TaxID=796925 RepID=A0A137P7M6_CONC2|nr:hypothetical protein CONCODRAFT_6467 [Conidiobolus coronatus NRRL 28638]|eukprot:KXN70931.1 hypothetical protein CONCODRAFT_6467 [Conidiobolus coronatus NRRL 28638]